MGISLIIHNSRCLPVIKPYASSCPCICAGHDDVMYSNVKSEDECYMIYSPETNAVLILTLVILHLITLLQTPSWKMLTLCALALLHHARPVLPSSSFSMLSTSLLGVDCLSSPLLGGPTLLHPLPPSWPHFPQVPGNAPFSCRAQYACAVYIQSIYLCPAGLNTILNRFMHIFKTYLIPDI
jgi:hypothetical protein